MGNVSTRPLFRRLHNRECVNFEASPNGKRRNGYPDQGAFVDTLALNNPLGTYWPDYVQAAALEILVGSDAEVGGGDRIQITANGDGITLDSNYTWNRLGSTDIDTTDTAINVIYFCMVSETEIDYAVTVL